MVGVDHTGGAKRHERQQSVDRETAGAGDDPGGFHLFPVKLRHAVDRFFLELRRQMLMPVPFGVFRHVAQPEIGGNVDDPDPLRHLQHDLLRLRVRHPTECDVHIVPVHLVNRGERGKVQMGEMAKDLAHLHPGLPVRRHGGDV